MSNILTGLDWSRERFFPVFQAVQGLVIYDVRRASYENQLAIITLVGLINRPLPRVYLILREDDVYWLEYVFKAIPQIVGDCRGDEVLFCLLATYRTSLQGLIIYDPELIDSVNVATTLAGRQRGMVVSSALAQELQTVYELPVLADLRIYRWKNRVEAYRWALEHLLDGSSCRLLAGLDPHGVTWLRSYLVATGAFVYWLDSRPQMSAWRADMLVERKLMRLIFQAMAPGAAHLGWFINESSGVALTSQAGIAVFASDFCTNLEVWAGLQPSSLSIPVQKPETLVATNKVYVSFTISEGDNFQYCQHHMLGLWRDEVRGSLPLGWTLSPALLQAAPALAEYYLCSSTSNDELIAGPSGIGYMFPQYWPDDLLPLFLRQTGEAMRAMGMTTLQVLDTDRLYASGLPLLSKISLTGMAFSNVARQKALVQGLAPYGVKGLLSGAGFLPKTGGWSKTDGLPIYQNLGLAGSVNQTMQLIRWASRVRKGRPLFLNIYILAWSMRPCDLKEVAQQLGDGYEIVLPRTLLALLAQHLS